jgi:hypothetical protein
MENEKEKLVYQFADRYFNTHLSGGSLLSIQPGPSQTGRQETRFILPEETFADMDLAWERDGHLERTVLCPETEWKTEAPRYSNRCGYYRASCETGPLAVEVSFELKGEALIHRVRIENTSGTPVRLMHTGYRFHGNTEFRFGESASDKVIGHHFISGHGSRLLFVRCDGQGPYLLVIPEDGTSLEYFEQERKSKSRANVYTAYTLSAEAVKKAGKSRMPTPGSSLALDPGESVTHVFRYVWARDNDDARRLIAENGLIDIDAAPGLTVPAGSLVTLSAKSRWDDLEVEFPEGAEPVYRDKEIFRFRLNKPGENRLVFRYDQGRRWTEAVFFVTQEIKTLIQKRGAFIAAHQYKDPSLWYCGLLAEWNNETGALLGPDNYDKIGGWRIYEVSCDDPGLSKPAFLSGKLAEYPDAGQAAALDLYVEKFVWGGLKRTEEEDYPYAIYGIPEWKQNRESNDPGLRGKLHIWRIYDYPHIALMYYNMYRIKRDFPDMPLTRDAKTYLCRARDTAVAMFTVPMDLERWDARNTGLYNELCIEDIIGALKAEGLPFDRLERHWIRKCRYFVMECTDLYGSEYPFDTTGFESTHTLAKHALRIAEDKVQENRHEPPVTREQAVRFMETQIKCNIATRGVLESAYYWYGSDYRSTNTAYTLSYMSQMGGWAILDYALYYADDPFRLLRLGYGSLLSSWALLNTGYWFPGHEHDGAASGGFEPMAAGKTWLDQEHHGGPWYYSCEIDLGFCGALRGAATVVAKDPEFGLICYGGAIQGNQVFCEDGVSRRFHIVTRESRLHVTIDKGRFDGAFTYNDRQLSFRVDPCGASGSVTLAVTAEGLGCIHTEESTAADGGELSLTLPCNNEASAVRLKWQIPLKL